MKSALLISPVLSCAWLDALVMRVFIALLGALLLTGCQASDPLSGKNDPKDPWWELGFIEPFYMKVWVEDSAVEDINGKLFRRTGGGSAAGGDMGYNKEWARGWGGGGGGSAKSVVGDAGREKTAPSCEINSGRFFCTCCNRISSSHNDLC